MRIVSLETSGNDEQKFPTKPKQLENIIKWFIFIDSIINPKPKSIRNNFIDSDT